MIATVRIAPVERWCEGTRDTAIAWGAQLSNVVGMSIQIDISRMAEISPWCGGRQWFTVDSQIYERAAVDRPPAETICEHMLEMD